MWWRLRAAPCPRSARCWWAPGESRRARPSRPRGAREPVAPTPWSCARRRCIGRTHLPRRSSRTTPRWPTRARCRCCCTTIPPSPASTSHRDLIGRLAEHPNIVGVKETSTDGGAVRRDGRCRPRSVHDPVRIGARLSRGAVRRRPWRDSGGGLRGPGELHRARAPHADGQAGGGTPDSAAPDAARSRRHHRVSGLPVSRRRSTLPATPAAIRVLHSGGWPPMASRTSGTLLEGLHAPVN